ncbi:MAG: hypothetical protein ABIO70_08180 [Pseudomonadota bacterium]
MSVHSISSPSSAVSPANPLVRLLVLGGALACVTAPSGAHAAGGLDDLSASDRAWLELALCTVQDSPGPVGFAAAPAPARPSFGEVAADAAAEAGKAALQSAATSFGRQAGQRLASHLIPGGGQITQAASTASRAVSTAQQVAATAQSVASTVQSVTSTVQAVTDTVHALQAGPPPALSLRLASGRQVAWEDFSPVVLTLAPDSARVAGCLEEIGEDGVRALLASGAAGPSSPQVARLLRALGTPVAATVAEAGPTQVPALAAAPAPAARDDGPPTLAALPGLPPFDPNAVPEDLLEGREHAKKEALEERYEPLPGATALIAWVMQNDPNEEVRFKAWRVIRARWGRGTGDPAEHQAVASWLAIQGENDELRAEAVGAMGAFGDDMALVELMLGDPDEDVHRAAAQALATMGRRLGLQAEARVRLARGSARQDDQWEVHAMADIFEENAY